MHGFVEFTKEAKHKVGVGIVSKKLAIVLFGQFHEQRLTIGVHVVALFELITLIGENDKNPMQHLHILLVGEITKAKTFQYELIHVVVDEKIFAHELAKYARRAGRLDRRSAELPRLYVG